MIAPKDIVAEARKWLNVPFLHQGRTRRGADCVGLVYNVGTALGVDLSDVKAYHRFPNKGLLDAQVQGQLTRIKLGQLQLGDILLLRFTEEAQHVAFLGDKGNPFSMIHSYSKVGKVVEHRYAQVWQARTVGAYRFPGVEVI